MSFESDIKPLFRELDRDDMAFVFDLWSYDDVKENAAGILERLEDGTMPCDGPWDEARLRTLRDWIADPQRFKPGARMPSYEHVAPATLDALAAWLEQLR